MNQIKSMSFIMIITVLSLVMQLFIINSVMAQSTNTTPPQNRNNTMLIVNLKNHTISLVDTRTNETLGVTELKLKPVTNNTTNESLTINPSNTTSSKILSPENTTTNETLVKNTANATTNENLTEKFSSLQGK